MRVSAAGRSTRHPRGPIATHSARCNKHNEVARHQRVRAAFSDTHLAAVSSRQFHCRLRCKHDNDTTVGGRTHCENVYLSGRHRQKWLYVGNVIQTCSHHPAGTEQLLSIWPLGGCTPSMQEGGITPCCTTGCCPDLQYLWN